jgi:hypothetical protein
MSGKLPLPIGAKWEVLYAEALNETKCGRRKWLIEQTEEAITARCRSLGSARDADETRRMADAIWNLSLLRREAS